MKLPFSLINSTAKILEQRKFLSNIVRISSPFTKSVFSQFVSEFLLKLFLIYQILFKKDIYFKTNLKN
jgi:hypothetical protein